MKRKQRFFSMKNSKKFSFKLDLISSQVKKLKYKIESA